LPRFTHRGDLPRDLRTAEELASNGYTRLGEARAELLLGDGTIMELFSTSEARRLKHDLWPRGRELPRTESPAAAGDVPFGRARRSANPSTTSALEPGAARGRLSGQRSGSGGPTPSRLGDPREWLTALFSDGFVVIDTETTGLGKRAEIVEIAALDYSGEVLLESKVWPRAGRIPAAASRVHGMTIGDLAGAPTWPEVLLELERQLEGRRVLAWNAPFDERMALQSSRLWSLAPQLPAFECAMRGYAHARGIGSLSMRLERAAQVERVLSAPQEHRSMGDARLVVAVLRRLMEARTVPA